jgi:hypothetical protein
MSKILSNGENLEWRVCTPALLEEILNNKGCQILARPLQIFGHILAEVGERAAEINDPKLNALMCRLSIYAISNPYDPEYDKELSNIIISKFY